MPFRGITGEIVEVGRSGGELCLQWLILRFLDLPGEGLDNFESPRFGFSGARWHMRVWPNWLSSGRVSLALDRCDQGSSTRTVIVSVGVRGSGGGVEWRTEEERKFGKGEGWFMDGIYTRSELREQKDRMMPWNKLTIVCKMEVPGTTARGLKDTNGFKGYKWISTPIQIPPSMFNYGDYVCTAASTVTTSSFTFGLATSQSHTTTSTTGFKYGVPSSPSTSSILSSTDSTTNKTQIKKDTTNAGCSQVNRDTVNEIPVVNSERKISNSVTTNISSVISVSEAKEGVTPTVTACFNFITQPLLDSKKGETFPFGGVSQAPTAFSFFPSFATTPTTVMSPLLTYTASSNNAQISKPSTKTSTTNVGFSFSNNKSNPISVSQSKDTKLSRITSETVSPFVKTEVTVTTSTTTNTFMFGSTTTTSAPTAFSFSPSSATTTTTVMSPLFTYSASSNNAQISKLEGEQPSDECDICCEKPVECALNPCGHMSWCYNCALRFWEEDPPRCPMCRETIQNILKIYR